MAITWRQHIKNTMARMEKGTHLKEVLKEAIKSGGSSIDDYVRVSGKKGGYAPVYVIQKGKLLIRKLNKVRQEADNYKPDSQHYHEDFPFYLILIKKAFYQPAQFHDIFSFF